jgi:hypothetical protein
MMPAPRLRAHQPDVTPRLLRSYVRSKAKKGTCSFFGYGTAYIIRKGRRYTVALTAMTRSMTMADLARELLQQVRAAGIPVRYLVLDREFYSVAVIR